MKYVVTLFSHIISQKDAQLLLWSEFEKKNKQKKTLLNVVFCWKGGLERCLTHVAFSNHIISDSNSHCFQMEQCYNSAQYKIQYSIHELPVADLYRWSWGRWRVSESMLQLLQKMLTDYLLCHMY